MAISSAMRGDRTQSTGSRRGHTASSVNVGDGERMLSLAAGAMLGLFGLARIRLSGVVLAALGGALVYRGLSGYCNLYRALGIDRAGTVTGEKVGNLGVKIERENTVSEAPDTLYRIWRELSNLPRFMSHLERVERLDDRRSRWTLKTPVGVPPLEWEAEIINERPGEVIAWQSVSGSVRHAGAVRFERAADARSTVVRVELQYDPPGGEVAHVLARLFGQDAGSQIEHDLREFKRAVEAGELTPSTIQRHRVF